jgi:hypothetical protein
MTTEEGICTRSKSRHASPSSPTLAGPTIDPQPPMRAPSLPYETWTQVAAKHAGRATTPIAAAHIARAPHSLASPTLFQAFHLPDNVSTDNDASQRSVVLLSQRPPTVDPFCPSDNNNGGGKESLPPAPPNGASTGGPTPDAMFGGSSTDTPTSHNALSMAIKNTPPKTAITLDRLDRKWMGIFHKFLANWEEQERSLAGLRREQDRRLAEILADASALLSNAVNKAVIPFKEEIDATMANIKADVTALDVQILDTVTKAVLPFREELKATVADIKVEVSGLDEATTTAISNIATLETKVLEVVDTLTNKISSSYGHITKTALPLLDDKTAALATRLDILEARIMTQQPTDLSRPSSFITTGALPPATTPSRSPAVLAADNPVDAQPVDVMANSRARLTSPYMREMLLVLRSDLLHPPPPLNPIGKSHRIHPRNAPPTMPDYYSRDFWSWHWSQ